jgi:hypothetical protein
MGVLLMLCLLAAFGGVWLILAAVWMVFRVGFWFLGGIMGFIMAGVGMLVLAVLGLALLPVAALLVLPFAVPMLLLGGLVWLLTAPPRPVVIIRR